MALFFGIDAAVVVATFGGTCLIKVPFHHDGDLAGAKPEHHLLWALLFLIRYSTEAEMVACTSCLARMVAVQLTSKHLLDSTEREEEDDGYVGKSHKTVKFPGSFNQDEKFLLVHGLFRCWHENLLQQASQEI